MGTGKRRAFLTDALREWGGHIGYSVAPAYRGRGYGKELLCLLLTEAGKQGIDRALITIDPANIPSRAVAAANGGVVERETPERVYVWVETIK